MRNLIRREYDKARALGWNAKQALEHARTWYAFRRRECGEHDAPDATHCVRIRAVPDEYAIWEDVAGDCFDPRANPDIPIATLERQEKAARERVNECGIWGMIGEYFDEVDQEWHRADSIWCVLGDDFELSGYDDDIKSAALDARAASVRKWRAMCKAAP